MLCPECYFHMTIIASKKADYITLRTYECHHCAYEGVIETREVLTGATTKIALANARELKLRTAARRIVRAMRAQKHAELSELERQALKYAARWILARYGEREELLIAELDIRKD